MRHRRVLPREVPVAGVRFPGGRSENLAQPRVVLTGCRPESTREGDCVEESGFAVDSGARRNERGTAESVEERRNAMTLYLGIPPASGIDWGYFAWYSVKAFLLSWLRSCCDDHSQTGVVTIGNHHGMGARDGLVYLLGDQSDSVIARLGANPSPNLDAGQTTARGRAMLSEVYVNASTTYATAANVYHELLHNKFRLSIDIHQTPGGNFTNSIAPYDDGGPSDADVSLMCQALSETAFQCQDGFDL
jgi:hypothetical protein